MLFGGKQGKRGCEKYKYGIDELEGLFGVERRTLKRWEREGKVELGDIRSVVKCYFGRKNLRELIDAM